MHVIVSDWTQACEGYDKGTPGVQELWWHLLRMSSKGSLFYEKYFIPFIISIYMDTLKARKLVILKSYKLYAPL